MDSLGTIQWSDTVSGIHATAFKISPDGTKLIGHMKSGEGEYHHLLLYDIVNKSIVFERELPYKTKYNTIHYNFFDDEDSGTELIHYSHHLVTWQDYSHIKGYYNFDGDKVFVNLNNKKRNGRFWYEISGDTVSFYRAGLR
jgi:hypothetical protein